MMRLAVALAPERLKVWPSIQMSCPMLKVLAIAVGNVIPPWERDMGHTRVSYSYSTYNCARAESRGPNDYRYALVALSLPRLEVSRYWRLISEAHILGIVP